MAMFDMLALGVVFICIVLSMMRGVIAELLGLLTWIVALLVAKIFAVSFAQFALTSIQPEAFSVVVGFVLLFVAAWLAQYFLRSLLTNAVSAVGLGSINRLFGGLFGAAKGIIIVTIAVLVCAFTDLPKTDGWRTALSAPYFEALAIVAVPYLPPVMADQIKYPTL
jgi:membrane protein required for colicin V production